MFNFLKSFYNKNKDLEEKMKEETVKELNGFASTLLDNFILCDGKKVPIDCKVIQKSLPPSCYRTEKKPRHPNMIVTHWDVALSATSCFNILKKVSISTHFCIDNDGTIFQFVDTNNIAWHAGPTSIDKKQFKGIKVASWNNNSIGVDISNAYYLKYQNTYIKNGFGPRPIMNARVHKTNLGPFLGFYPRQIESYKKLVKCLTTQYNIPLVCPSNIDGICDEAVIGEFNGVLNHYNLTRNKIDCAGLDLPTLLEEIRKNTSG